MLLSGGEVQLQAGTEAQAAQLSRNPSHRRCSRVEQENGLGRELEQTYFPFSRRVGS